MKLTVGDDAHALFPLSYGFMSTGDPLRGNGWLPWLNVASDLMTALAFLSIAQALLFFMKKRPDQRCRRPLALFAGFMMLGGISRLLSTVNIWMPMHFLSIVANMAMAAVACIAAAVFWGRFPKLDSVLGLDRVEAAEKHHKELSSLLQSVLDAIPSAVFWKDVNGNYMGCNSKHAAQLGLESPGEIVGKTDFDFWSGELAEKYRADDSNVMLSAASISGYEEPYHGPKGDVRYAFTSKVPLLNAENEIVGIVGAYEEITARKKAEIELKDAKRKAEDNERHFRELFNSVTDILFIHDFPVGKFIDVNDAACEVLGYTREEFREMTPVDIDDPNFTPEMMPSLQVSATIQSGRGVIFERRHRRKDGTYIPVEIHTRLIDHGGRNVVMSVARDVSERKRMDQELRETMELNRFLIERSGVGISVYDRQGQCVIANEAFADNLGISRELAMGQNFRQIESWKQSGMLEAARDALLRNITRSVMVCAKAASGNEVWFNSQFTPLDRESGRHLLVMTTDVSDFMRSKLALQQSQATLYALFNAIKESLIILNSNDMVEMINKTGAARLGKEPADLIGREIYSLLPVDVRMQRMALVKKCRTTGIPLQVRDKRAGKWFDQTLYPVKDESGNVSGIAVFAVDVTDSVTREEAMRRAMAELERMNVELREFVSVSSHDLQEPLRKIGGYLGFLKGHLGSAADETTQDYLKRLDDAAHRLRALIMDLLGLSRVTTQAHAFEKTDLEETMRRVVEDLEMRIREYNAVVEYSLPETVEADPLQIRQLFQNLVGNSLKFRKKEVPPVIHVLSSRNNAPVLIRGVRYDIDDLAVIQFADNGIGFQQKYAEKIFGLFQRLHRSEEYEGTGVGLAICKKIVERHDGSISVKGNPGEGAVFTVYLPVRQRVSRMGDGIAGREA